jgi:hypothetical protein
VARGTSAILSWRTSQIRKWQKERVTELKREKSGVGINVKKRLGGSETGSDEMERRHPVDMGEGVQVAAVRGATEGKGLVAEAAVGAMDRVAQPLRFLDVR